MAPRGAKAPVRERCGGGARRRRGRRRGHVDIVEAGGASRLPKDKKKAAAAAGVHAADRRRRALDDDSRRRSQTEKAQPAIRYTIVLRARPFITRRHARPTGAAATIILLLRAETRLICHFASTGDISPPAGSNSTLMYDVRSAADDFRERADACLRAELLTVERSAFRAKRDKKEPAPKHQRRKFRAWGSSVPAALRRMASRDPRPRVVTNVPPRRFFAVPVEASPSGGCNIDRRLHASAAPIDTAARAAASTASRHPRWPSPSAKPRPHRRADSDGDAAGRRRLRYPHHRGEVRVPPTTTCSCRRRRRSSPRTGARCSSPALAARRRPRWRLRVAYAGGFPEDLLRRCLRRAGGGALPAF